LWVGQTGFNALPELTSRISRKIHTCQPVDATLAVPYLLGGDYYPANYSSQTRYIGLLHHLAGIQQDTGAFENNYTSLIRQANKDTRASQHAIVSALSFLNLPYDCLVRPTRQFVCFTPAFIFCQLPRGPPISALKTLL
jgi:hypothetical protein